MSPSEKAWCANAPNAILTRLRGQIGVARFRDLMVDLPDALEELRKPDLGAIAEFQELLGGDLCFPKMPSVTIQAATRL